MNINDITSPHQPHLCNGNYIGVAFVMNKGYKKMLSFIIVINYD